MPPHRQSIAVVTGAFTRVGSATAPVFAVSRWEPGWWLISCWTGVGWWRHGKG